jgi:hypothetical protein
MPLFKKLATLATAAEVARRYAMKNPDKASKFVDQAAKFVDKQTKGKYSGQISGVARKAKGAAGIHESPGHGPAGNGQTQGYDKDAGLGKTTDSSAPRPGQPRAGQ